MNENRTNNRDKDDHFEGDYLGNMWGWKFSWISLAMIAVLTGLMAYRSMVLGEDIFEEVRKKEVPAQVDSLKVDSSQFEK